MNMKKIGKILTISVSIIIAASTGCSHINVQSVKDVKEPSDYGIVYSLPANGLQISVIAEKTVHVKGPYSEFSEKFLGVHNIEILDKTEWKIENIRIQPFVYADTSATYLIESKGENALANISLTPEGFLCSINADCVQHESQEEVTNFSNQYSGNEFTDLSVKNYFKEVKKTSYREVKTDSTYKKIPEYHSMNERKSKEEKAEEAANFIFKLRKRKFKLMAGLSDITPPANGIDAMINELKELEASYVQLFTGYKYSEKIVRNFNYYPSPGNSEEELFWFSKSNGVSDKKTDNSTPVKIMLSTISKPSAPDFSGESMKKKAKGLYYRTPALVNISIYDKDRTITSDKMLIAQFGNISILPVSVLKEEDAVLIFNPFYGSLTQIKD